MRRRLFNRNQNRGIVGRSGGDFVFSAYVDSVNGNDSYSGLSPTRAKATLAAALALPQAAKQISLARGSTWFETLNTQSYDGTRVVAYGTGAAPLLRGDPVVASWTAEGSANVWKATVSHNLGNTTGRGRVYEDGVLMTRVADVATCSSTPGSFVDIKGSDGTPWTVKIHPTGNGNPNSNGKVYSVVSINDGVLFGNNTSIEGIQAKRFGGNNGSFDSTARLDTVIRRCVATDGSKHNITSGHGVIMQSVALFADPPTSYETQDIFTTSYVSNAAGLDINYTEVHVVGNSATSTTNTSSRYSHDAVSGKFASASAVQCGTVDFQYDSEFQSYSDSYDGCLSLRVCTVPMQQSVTRHQGYISSPLNSGATTFTNSVVVTDSVYYIANRNNVNDVFRPQGTYTLTNNAFYGPPDGGSCYWTSNASGTATATITKNIYFGGRLHICLAAGHTYNGDYNIFCAYDPGNSNVNFYSRDTASADLQTLSAWQASTGKDANSVVGRWVDQVAGGQYALWLAWANAAGGTDLTTIGPAVGDYRVNPNARVYNGAGTAFIGTFADGVTLLTTAGPQTYRNWNTRAAVSGTPLKWPKIPATQTEALTFTSAPQAWDYYA